jgi:hypothetical protein
MQAINIALSTTLNKIYVPFLSSLDIWIVTYTSILNTHFQRLPTILAMTWMILRDNLLPRICLPFPYKGCLLLLVTFLYPMAPAGPNRDALLLTDHRYCIFAANVLSYTREKNLMQRATSSPVVTIGDLLSPATVRTIAVEAPENMALIEHQLYVVYPQPKNDVLSTYRYFVTAEDSMFSPSLVVHTMSSTPAVMTCDRRPNYLALKIGLLLKILALHAGSVEWLLTITLSDPKDAGLLLFFPKNRLSGSEELPTFLRKKKIRQLTP